MTLTTLLSVLRGKGPELGSLPVSSAVEDRSDANEAREETVFRSMTRTPMPDLCFLQGLGIRFGMVQGLPRRDSRSRRMWAGHEPHAVRIRVFSEKSKICLIVHEARSHVSIGMLVFCVGLCDWPYAHPSVILLG